MIAHIITIGDEILIGQVVDTNSAFLASELNKIGFKVEKIVSISDTKESIFEALSQSEKSAQLILMTGGLGPTSDDITKQTLAEYFGSKLQIYEPAMEHVKDYLKKRSRKYTTQRNIDQAKLPNNCIPLYNKIGTAFGMWFEKQKTIFISMPGVPFELKEMMVNEVVPRIKNKFELPPVFNKTIMTSGLAESIMSDMISEWENNLPDNVKLAYLPSPGVLRLRLTISNCNEVEAERISNQLIENLSKRIGDYIFGFDDIKLEMVVGNLLIQSKSTLALAESCTGGTMSSFITSVAGSSEYFKGSVTAYSNKIKTSVLHVKTDSLDKYGAVSEAVVKEMATGIKNKFDVDYSIATSGIAGPTGGTDNKPVGTVWIAVSSKNETIAKKFQFGEDRRRNIIRASNAALNMLREIIINDMKSKKLECNKKNQ